MVGPLRAELGVTLPGGERVRVRARALGGMEANAPHYAGVRPEHENDDRRAWEIEAVDVQHHGVWKAAPPKLAGLAEQFLRDHPAYVAGALEDACDSEEILARAAEWRAEGRPGTELREYIRKRGLDVPEE